MSHPGFGYSYLSAVKADLDPPLVNSAVETPLIAWPIRSGLFNEVGQVLRVNASGLVANAVAGNIDFKVYVGSALVGSYTVTASDGDTFSLSSSALVRVQQGPAEILGTVAPAGGILVHGGIVAANESSADASVDLRAPLEVTIKATMADADPGNSIQLLSAVFEIGSPAWSL